MEKGEQLLDSLAVVSTEARPGFKMRDLFGDVREQGLYRWLGLGQYIHGN